MASPTSETVIRSEIFFAEKDQALRDDVRRLGKLVGELVREQGGEALYDVAEAARRASIAHREGDEHAVQELTSLLAELAPRTARDVIRAFSTYFQMVNMAEKVHRIRRRREYLSNANKPQPSGFVETLQGLRAAGVDIDEIEQILGSICVEPVFSAPSTEATRRSLLRKQQSIARHLVAMLDPYLTPQESAAELGQIRLQMTTGWQTDDRSQERRLGDESEHVLFFLTDVLYRMIPPFYEGLEAAIAKTYDQQARQLRLPVLIKFASWVGGDMHGDASITAKSIRATLVRQRALLLNLYFDECGDLARNLSQCVGRIGVAPELHTRSELYAGHFAKAAHSVSARHRSMPYRVFLRLVQARLQATFDDTTYPYESPAEFIADIELVAGSLRANHGQHAGLFAVKRLLRRARTFGFHMATLDVRQHAIVHRRVIGEVLNETDWLERSSAARTARITEALERRESPLGTLPSEARRTLAVFQTIAHCRRKYGSDSVGPYVVSMAHGPDDVLSVLLLAKWGHLGSKGANVPLDIVPLFETGEDLQSAGQIMTGLLNDERYRKHLKGRGDHQMVMIAYSDSNHDGGLVSVYWSLYEAQQELIKTLRGFGIRLTLFHGRGGMISASRGHVHEAVLAAPEGAVSRHFRVAEQGETINANFGLRGIAMRTLEQNLSALLSVTAKPPAIPTEQEHWHEIMGAIADASREAFKGLVAGSEGFERYFRCATPIDVIERLGIGVRPVDQADDEFNNLTAASWEFAWAQNRCLIPDWFGFAAGMAHGIERYGEDALSEMFSHWRFLRVLVEDVEVSLAKADLDIAERYSALSGDLHERFFPIIRDEYVRSVEFVLKLSSQSKLLENSDTLRRAIRLRNPYVDPMSLLQVNLLERWRASGREDDEVLQALEASINGIAHGMQNTG